MRARRGMLFNVSQLLKEPSGAARRYDVDEAASPGDGSPRIAVRGSVAMMRTDAGVWVSARLMSRLRCVCSRCAADMEAPIAMNIEEEYLPSVDVRTGARLRDPDPMDENFCIDHAHILDMSEAVRQYFDLNAPLKPICTDDCKGICLACGADRNEGDCGCDDFVPDPRWGALLDVAALSHRSRN